MPGKFEYVGGARETCTVHCISGSASSIKYHSHLNLFCGEKRAVVCQVPEAVQAISEAGH